VRAFSVSRFGAPHQILLDCDFEFCSFISMVGQHIEDSPGDLLKGSYGRSGVLIQYWPLKDVPTRIAQSRREETLETR
jgi:hypothetical protein